MEDVGEQISTEFWKQQFWEKSFWPFHFTEPQPNLIEFYESTFGTRKSSRIFIPLCGKTVDMKWLEQKGHHIVGVEVSDIAVKMFFEENGMEYDIVAQGKFQVFKATQRNITIFCGDIFDANKDILGLFDGIWDRGSFTSIHPAGDGKKRYLELMRSIARNENVVYLMNLLEDHFGHKGPPYSITHEKLKCIAGNTFDVKLLSREHFDEPKISKEPLIKILYQLKVKPE